MQYEVRYQVSGEEIATTIDADDAASAAQAIQQQHTGADETFELIQVQLLDEPSAASIDHAEPVSTPDHA